MTHSTVTCPQMLVTHDEGEYPWHIVEMCFCFHREFPFGFQVWITTSVCFIYSIGCVFVNAGEVMKINVIFHRVVLDAELEMSVIKEMDEGLLKIRHMNFKLFFMFLRCFYFSGVSVYTILNA